MKKMLKRSTLLLVIMAMVLIPLGSASIASERVQDEDKTAAAMVLDLILVRPIGICATTIGAVVFIVSMPFSAIGGNIGSAWKHLVAKPAKFTFARPIGDFVESP